eukprot:1108771_1
MMNDDVLCQHCNHYANLSFKVNDTVEINSAPEDDDDPQSHMYKGTVLKITPKKKQVSVRLHNQQCITKFRWPAIHIHTESVSPLYDDTEVQRMNELITAKDHIILEMKLQKKKQETEIAKYDKKIAAKKWKFQKYKAARETEQEERQGEQQKLTQSLNQKDEVIHNLQVLLQNTELQRDALKVELEEQQYIIRQSYEAHERIRKEEEQRMDHMKHTNGSGRRKNNEWVKILSNTTKTNDWCPI